MSENNEKPRSKLSKILPYITATAIYLLVSYVRGDATDAQSSSGTTTLTIVIVLLSAIIGLFAQIILSEVGRLICGLLSGYKFVSYNIFFKTMLIKVNGKLKMKKFLSALGNEACMMAPPQPVNELYPYALYLLGSAFMSFLLSGVFLFIFMALKDVFPYAGAVFIPNIAIGLLLGLLDFLPLRIYIIVSAGYYMAAIRGSERVRRANWFYLAAYAKISFGERLKNIHSEWFEFPEEYDFNDPILAKLACLGISRLIDSHDFNEAKILALRFLCNGDKLSKTFIEEVRCELLFLEIIGEACEKRTEDIQRLYTYDLVRHIELFKSNLSKLRLKYAYKRLVLNDSEEAQETLETFNKTCNEFPFAGICESERELIAIVDDLAAEI